MFLSPGSFGHIANIVKGYAIAIGVVFAIWFFWNQLRQSNKLLAVDRRAKAQNIWSHYLKNKSDLGIMMRQADEPIAAAPELDFIAYLLSVGDEILIINPTKEWRDAIRGELSAHKSILASKDNRLQLQSNCSRELAMLIDDVAAAG